jgi:hypothetical protein
MRQYYVNQATCWLRSNTVHTRNRHGVVAVGLTSKRSGGILPLSKHIRCQEYILKSLWVFLQRTEKASWCVHSAFTPTSLSIHPPHQQLESNQITTAGTNAWEKYNASIFAEAEGSSEKTVCIYQTARPHIP